MGLLHPRPRSRTAFADGYIPGATGVPVPVHTPFIFSSRHGSASLSSCLLLEFRVMNVIIAYLPSGDKKVIVPSAQRYFIIPHPSPACFASGHPHPLHRLLEASSLLNDAQPRWTTSDNYAITRESKTRLVKSHYVVWGIPQLYLRWIHWLIEITKKDKTLDRCIGPRTNWDIQIFIMHAALLPRLHILWSNTDTSRNSHSFYNCFRLCF